MVCARLKVLKKGLENQERKTSVHPKSSVSWRLNFLINTPRWRSLQVGFLTQTRSTSATSNTSVPGSAPTCQCCDARQPLCFDCTWLTLCHGWSGSQVIYYLMQLNIPIYLHTCWYGFCCISIYIYPCIWDYLILFDKVFSLNRFLNHPIFSDLGFKKYTQPGSCHRWKSSMATWRLDEAPQIGLCPMTDLHTPWGTSLQNHVSGHSPTVQTVQQNGHFHFSDSDSG